MMSFQDSLLFRLAPVIATVIAAYHLLYRWLIHALDAYSKTNNSKWMPTIASEYCNDKPCTRNDLIAFQVVSAVAFYICGILAIVNYRYYYHSNNNSTPETRIFGASNDTYTRMNTIIVTVNLCYQIWDFIVSFTIKEHATVIMLTHHFIAGAVCAVVLRYHYLGRYAHYFLGCTEISSIFLVWLDLGRFLEKSATSSTFNTFTDHVCAPLFFVTFLYYRVLKWWPVSLQYYRDVQAYKENCKKKSDDTSVSRSSSAKEVSLTIITSFTVPMGLLQLYWLILVVQTGVDMVKELLS